MAQLNRLREGKLDFVMTLDPERGMEGLPAP